MANALLVWCSHSYLTKGTWWDRNTEIYRYVSDAERVKMVPQLVKKGPSHSGPETSIICLFTLNFMGVLVYFGTV